MCEKLFCFLDVLGFSSLVSNDEYEVGDIFNRLELISNVAIGDQKIRENRNIPNDISNPAIKMELSGFENYQWGSDSMFAYGDSANCDLCILQIAHFIYASLQQSIRYFPKPRKKIPLLLLRGGIALGEVNSVPMTAIFNKELHHTINVFGKAALKVTCYEKSIKGPRVFLDNLVYSHLSDNVREYVVHPYDLPQVNVYELLWPMIAFNKENLVSYKSTNELNVLDEFLGIAEYHFEHYKSKKDRGRLHFDEFVYLILRSAKRFYSTYNHLDLLNDYMDKLNIQSIDVPMPYDDYCRPRCCWTKDFNTYVNDMFKQIIYSF